MPQSTRLKPFVFALLALGNGVGILVERRLAVGGHGAGAAGVDRLAVVTEQRLDDARIDADRVGARQQGLLGVRQTKPPNWVGPIDQEPVISDLVQAGGSAGKHCNQQ